MLFLSASTAESTVVARSPLPATAVAAAMADVDALRWIGVAAVAADVNFLATPPALPAAAATPGAEVGGGAALAAASAGFIGASPTDSVSAAKNGLCSGEAGTLMCSTSSPSKSTQEEDSAAAAVAGCGRGGGCDIAATGASLQARAGLCARVPQCLCDGRSHGHRGGRGVGFSTRSPSILGLLLLLLLPRCKHRRTCRRGLRRIAVPLACNHRTVDGAGDTKWLRFLLLFLPPACKRRGAAHAATRVEASLCYPPLPPPSSAAWAGRKVGV